MKKRIVLLLLVVVLLVFGAGCGAKKTLTCDHCGKEVQVDADSNMTEDWSIFCEECNEELFGDDPVLGAK